MAEKTVIGKNVWLYIRTAPTVIIPIKCLTQHTITGSQEISNTETKCGRKKTPQGSPDYQITGEGQIMLFTGGDDATNYSAGALFRIMADQQRVEIVSAPDGVPQEGDETYSGFAYLSEWELVYDAGAESTFSFTFDVDGELELVTEGPTT
jgi:hypothetical protein